MIGIYKKSETIIKSASYVGKKYSQNDLRPIAK